MSEEDNVIRKFCDATKVEIPLDSGWELVIYHYHHTTEDASRLPERYHFADYDAMHWFLSEKHSAVYSAALTALAVAQGKDMDLGRFGKGSNYTADFKPLVSVKLHYLGDVPKDAGHLDVELIYTNTGNMERVE